MTYYTVTWWKREAMYIYMSYEPLVRDEAASKIFLACKKYCTPKVYDEIFTELSEMFKKYKTVKYSDWRKEMKDKESQQDLKAKLNRSINLPENFWDDNTAGTQ